ncbi:MAG TPA: hypothetical protein VNJ07_08390 [Chitinophagales bacterium]|nr:hypothetical protein [Chitinophagales bacterium]
MYKELLRDILLSVLDSIRVIEKRFAPIQKEDDFIFIRAGTDDAPVAFLYPIQNFGDFMSVYNR